VRNAPVSSAENGGEAVGVALKPRHGLIRFKVNECIENRPFISFNIAVHSLNFIPGSRFNHGKESPPIGNGRETELRNSRNSNKQQVLAKIDLAGHPRMVRPYVPERFPACLRAGWGKGKGAFLGKFYLSY
jgi:hypothetical protein